LLENDFGTTRMLVNELCEVVNLAVNHLEVDEDGDEKVDEDEDRRGFQPNSKSFSCASTTKE